MSLPELVSIMDKRSKKRPAWSFREKFKSFFSKKTMSSSQHEVHLESDDGKASSNDKAEPEGEAPALAHHYDGDNSAPATQQDEDTPISNSKTDRHGKLASEIWEAAFEEVKADEKMNNFALFYEEQIKKVVDQENPRTPMDGESFEQIGKEQCLEIVGKTLKDVEKHQEAKDNAITVLTVVKGLSSFIGSMLSECPPAALAWAGICSCIPIITAPMEQDKDMMIGLQHICDRAPTYFDLPGIALDDANPDPTLRKSIQSLYSGVLKYVMLSICLVHSMRLRRFWIALTKRGQWKDILQGITDAEKLLHLDIRVRQVSKHVKLTEDIVNILKETSNQTQAKERKDFLFSLERVNNQTNLRKTKRRLEHTCQWFRQHEKLKLWLAGTDGLLLVSAQAGCGKSVIAKYLIEEVLYEENHTATICYFLFKDSNPQARSFLNASKALLHCLLKSNPTLVDDCRQELHSNLESITEFEMVWRIFIQAAKRARTRPIFCVLDALDESDPTTREDFLDHLKSYFNEKDGAPHVRFIITTRGHPQIIRLFDDIASYTVTLDGDSDKDKRQIQEEISIVMDYRLGKLKEDFPDMSDEVVGILRTGLAENGSEQRTYLWMHLMFDYIRKNRFCTREEWREIFRNPPDTVDRTYEGLLQSVTPQAKERVRTLLALILAAKRPLTVAELSTAVNCRINTLESRKFDLDDIPDEKEFGSWIRWECGSFVTIYEGKAFLIHQTAKEFLLEAPEADHGGWQGSMTKHVIHQYMAESCISFLSLEKFQQQEHADYVQTKISSLGEDATVDSHLDGCDLLIQATLDGHLEARRQVEGLRLEAFVVYSAVNWMHHFRQCQQTGPSDGQVTDVGKEFFDLYLSLFTKKHTEGSTRCGEWKQRSWYSIMMASKPRGTSSQMEITQDGYCLLSPDTLTVSSLACLFDHRRLLMFALEEDTDTVANDLAIHSITARPGLSLPHFAACGNSLWCLNNLHSRGHNVDLKDFVGQTPLHKAMMVGNEQVVEGLLKFGASKTALDCANMTPLTWALISLPDWIEKHIASSESGESELRSLLRSSAMAEVPGYGDKGRKHRMQMLQEMHDETPGYLPAFVNAIASRVSPLHRKKPFMLATYLGNLYENSYNALHISVQDEKRIHNTFSLVQYGGGMLNAVDAFANTPFHTATLANNVLAMRLLLCGTEGKGLKNRKGERGDTPLHMACRMGHREAAEDLINTGVDFKIRNDDGLTALELDRPPRLGVGLAKLIRKRYGYTTSSGFGSSDSDESGAEESGSDESGSGESDA